MRRPAFQLKSHSSATPDEIYDVLADLRTHLIWGGKKQSMFFRLVSLDAPEGQGEAGTSFSSQGIIPMARARSVDHSTVTEAARPTSFEFVTTTQVDSTLRKMRSRYRHRYEIAKTAGGSEVSYTLTELEATHSILRFALPVVRTMTWRVGFPFMAGRGFKNMLKMAEERARVQDVALASVETG